MTKLINTPNVLIEVFIYLQQQNKTLLEFLHLQFYNQVIQNLVVTFVCVFKRAVARAGKRLCNVIIRTFCRALVDTKT